MLGCVVMGRPFVDGFGIASNIGEVGTPRGRTRHSKPVEDHALTRRAAEEARSGAAAEAKAKKKTGKREAEADCVGERRAVLTRARNSPRL